jgi:AcrR family transcriptional regulator
MYMLLSIRALGSCAAKTTVIAAITPTITQGCLKNFSMLINKLLTWLYGKDTVISPCAMYSFPVCVRKPDIMSYFVRHLDNIVETAGRHYGREEHTMAKNEVKTGNDPRVRYTRKILKDSLIELMKTRPVTKIGVKEVCALAGISRSTFYTYYTDVEHLLAEIEEEVAAYFEDRVDKIPAKHARREFEMKSQMLQYVADNSGSLRILLSENGDPDFQKRFFQRFILKARKIIHDTSEDPGETSIHEGYSVFVVHGAIGLIQYWLKNNMHIPIPVLAKMVVKLTQPAKG